MERYRVRASCYNNAKLSPTPNDHFFRSSNSKPAAHISLPPKLASPHPEPTSLSRRTDDNDTEISIFDAERYFNGGGAGDNVDDTLKNSKTVILNGSGTSTAAAAAAAESLVDVISSTHPRDSSASSADGGHGRTSYSRARSFRAATPTASSEASWNSQTGLLANAPGSVAVSVRACPALNESRRKGPSSSTTNSAGSFRGGRRRRFFGLRCPCYDEKSVEVEDKFSETRSSIRSPHHGSTAGRGFPKLDVDVLSDSSARVPKKETAESMTKFKIRATEPPGLFSFPVLSPLTAVPPPPAREPDLEPARESLEVFRPSEELARTLRKSSQLLHLRMAPVRDDDVASDTSSDLFELESFSAHSAAAYRRRDSLDDLPKLASTAGPQLRRRSEDSVAPSECYAPSEASVEWSVTTAEWGLDRASVANFSSAASDCGMGLFDSAAAAAGKEDGGVKKRGGGGGGGGGLLNCRSEKAVTVGPKPVRVGPH